MADSTLDTLHTSTPQNMPDDLPGTVLTVANGDLGDANTSFFYFDMVKSGFNIFSLQFVIGATTLTIEGSNDAPSVSNAGALWSDITDVCTSGVATNFTATGTLSILFPLPWSRLRVRRLTTNAVNSLVLKLTRGRLR